MFDHPDWAQLIEKNGTGVIVIDQCRFLDHDPSTSGVPSSEKATAIMACPISMPDARRILCDPSTGVGKRCNHDKGVHRSLKGFRTAGSERYSSTLCKCLAMCLCPTFASDAGLLANGSFAEFTFVSGIVYGKRLKKEAITSEFIHRCFGPHGEARRLRHLPDALCDADPSWAKVINETICEDCLRGDAPKVGHHGHLPEVEGLWFVDFFHTQVGTLWYNETSVIGFKHSVSKLCRTWRARKSQAPDAFELFFAWSNSNGKPCTWIHCDQANDLKGSKIVPIVRKHACRITTTTLASSNQNPIEPEWKVFMKCTRILLIQGSMPLQAWGVAWDDTEEGRALYPGRDPPHACPLGKFIGEKPAGSHRRPVFCLCYPSITPRLPSGTLVNKTAAQAPRALLFGYHGGRTGSFEQLGIERCEPGYACYIPSDEHSCGTHYAGQIVVTADVRCVPDCFPGLQRTAGGGWTIPSSKIPFLTKDSQVPQGTPEPSVQDLNDDDVFQEGEDTNLKIGMRVVLESGKQAEVMRLHLSPDDGEQYASVRCDDGTEESVISSQLKPYVPPPAEGDAQASERLTDITNEEQLTDTPERDAPFDYEALTFRRGFGPELAEPHTETQRKTQSRIAQEPPEMSENHTSPIEPPPEEPPPSKDVLLVPADHWPDYPCDEHDGRGWEVTVVGRKGRWAKCRFTNATSPDGRCFADEWRPLETLIKLTGATKEPAPTAHGEDGERATILSPPQGATDFTPIHNTVPHVSGANPLKEPARPVRDRSAPERYTVGMIAASHVELKAACKAGERLHVDVGALSERLVGRLSFASVEDEASFTSHLEELDLNSQRAICLLADHDAIVSELGSRSPRRLYSHASCMLWPPLTLPATAPRSATSSPCYRP